MAVTHTTEALAESLVSLRDEIERQGSLDIAQRLNDLVMRCRSGRPQAHVAFCGLFSAGKSSLLNRLTDSRALATGAVPTTAEVAEVQFEGAEGNVVLLDTPGVDSTDAAHQAATEAALHRADVVALVMDYQHVESEDNLDMARQLCDSGKTLWLIVNQVDKHLDWELPFADFIARVERTFHEYGIEYEALFYTSTKPAQHNQTERLLDALTALAAGAEQLAEESVRNSARELVRQHVDALLSQRWQEAEDALYNAFGMLPHDAGEAAAWLSERRQEAVAWQAEVDAVRRQMKADQERDRSEFSRLIDLAQVAPYETAEKGRFYIESLRPGFSVGWLGRKEKTEREQNARLTAFCEDLAERTEKFLVWPLKNRMREYIDNAAWADSAFLADLDDVQVTVSVDLCRSQVHSGAIESDQYPYQYVRDVVAALKRRAGAEVTRLLDSWYGQAEIQLVEREQPGMERQAALAKEIEVTKLWLAVTQDREALANALLSGLVGTEAVQQEGAL